METIIFLLIGLVIGAVIGYFFIRLSLQKDYVPLSRQETLLSELTDLKVKLASRLTKDEISDNYVSKSLFESVSSNLTRTKEVIETKYVAKESFEIIKDKLIKTEDELTFKEQTIGNLTNQITELRKEKEYLNEKLTIFRKEIEDLHSLTKEQFKNLATDILEEKKKLFIEANKSELSTILDPLKTDISNFKKTVEDTRKEDIQDLTSLKKEIDSLLKLNTQLSDDAQQLASALKSDVKVQGNWGEDRLNMILEAEGLQKYIDYKNQGSYRDEEQDLNRKPDIIMNLPNGKHFIIDSKVSLTAYVNYFNSSDPAEKSEHLKSHLKSVIDHIDLLSDKNYQSLAGLNTPDYVFLFMPIESALTLALNAKPDIFNRAIKKKIVIVTPTIFVATLKIVKILWQKENQVKNVEEIFRQCGKLYDKFVIFLEEMEKVGTGLNVANKAFKDAMESLTEGTQKGNTIIGRFETIKKLEAKTNKNIPDKFKVKIDMLDNFTEANTIDNSDGTTIEENDRTIDAIC